MLNLRKGIYSTLKVKIQLKKLGQSICRRIMTGLKKKKTKR